MASDQSRKNVLDVNTVAVFLVNDHPGNKSVSSIIEAGLKGAYVPILLDIIPVRAYWIMTKRWGCPEEESRKAIIHFVKEYDRLHIESLQKETIVESFKLAEMLNHDVFDCIYLAFALQEKAQGIITTDTDFERLCRQTELEYINPVPKEILKRFKNQNK